MNPVPVVQAKSIRSVTEHSGRSRVMSNVLTFRDLLALLLINFFFGLRVPVPPQNLG